jgi:hypothetical protein
MKHFALFLLFVSGVLLLRAGIKTDVEAVPQDEIAKGAIPVSCLISPRVNGGIVLKLVLKPYEVAGEFLSYELRVLKEPVSIADLKGGFFRLDQIARRNRSLQKTATFELNKDEIANSYIVITYSLGVDRDGIGKWRSLCISVPALVAR